MNATSKTIQIFLPGGDPRGIRVAEVTTRIVQAIGAPRSLLGDFLKMPESGQVALYFLFGTSDDGAEERVYVGQTGDLRARLAKHNKEKEFWQRAVAVISRTNSLTQTHALFLEWHCLQEATKAARYTVENGNAGSKPHTPAPLEADCLEIYDTARTLLATLGYPVFEALVKSREGADEVETFFCTSSGADGRGIYTEEGFVVLKGSLARRESVPSIQGTSVEAMRTKLLESGVLRPEGDKLLKFTSDHLFASPTGAVTSLLGRSSNGWVMWKNAAGKTLSEVKRQGAEDDATT